MTDLNKTITVLFNVFKDGSDLCVVPVDDPDIEYSMTVGVNDRPDIENQYENMAKNLIRDGNNCFNTIHDTKAPSKYFFERVDGGTPQQFQLKTTISF